MPGAPRPSIGELTSPLGLGKALVFGDAQTGQLDKSNDRGDTILAITDACHAQEQAVRKALEPPPTIWSKVRAAWPF